MASKRLTNALREKIKTAAIAHRFDPLEEALCAECVDWGQRLAAPAPVPALPVAELNKLLGL